MQETPEHEIPDAKDSDREFFSKLERYRAKRGVDSPVPDIFDEFPYDEKIKLSFMEYVGAYYFFGFGKFRRKYAHTFYFTVRPFAPGNLIQLAMTVGGFLIALALTEAFEDMRFMLLCRECLYGFVFRTIRQSLH